MCGLRTVFRALRTFRERRAEVTPIVTQYPMPGEPEARLTSMERTVFEFILTGDHPNLRILREQLSDCVVTERELTGVGLFTHLRIADGHPPIQTDREQIIVCCVGLHSPQLVHGAGFLLFLEHGYLDFLEGVCNVGDEQWNDIVEFELSWRKPECRNVLLGGRSCW